MKKKVFFAEGNVVTPLLIHTRIIKDFFFRAGVLVEGEGDKSARGSPEGIKCYHHKLLWWKIPAKTVEKLIIKGKHAEKDVFIKEEDNKVCDTVIRPMSMNKHQFSEHFKLLNSEIRCHDSLCPFATSDTYTWG